MTKISETNQIILTNNAHTNYPEFKKFENPYENISKDLNKCSFNTYEQSVSPEVLIAEKKFKNKTQSSSSPLNNNRFVEIKDEDFKGIKLRESLLNARASRNGKISGAFAEYFASGRTEVKLLKKNQKLPSPLREEVNQQSIKDQPMPSKRNSLRCYPSVNDLQSLLSPGQQIEFQKMIAAKNAQIVVEEKKTKAPELTERQRQIEELKKFSQTFNFKA